MRFGALLCLTGHTLIVGPAGDSSVGKDAQESRHVWQEAMSYIPSFQSDCNQLKCAELIWTSPLQINSEPTCPRACSFADYFSIM